MTNRRHMSRLAIAGLIAVLGGALAARGSMDRTTARQDQAPPLPESVIEMRHHFVAVTRLHEAVIRGDLPDARSAAAALARMETPAAFATTGTRFVEMIRTDAQRAANAPDLAAAASATGQILGACGACHLTAVRPPIAAASERDLGGIVGHMREHQRALDELLQGLVTPSARLWSQGAGRLASEPLSTDRLPPDPGLTATVTQAETRVHQLADRASQAGDTAARTAAYAELLTTCAECHRLHGRIWGPRSTPPVGAGS
jgi:mono/diheme cytochrome c family protein